MAVAGIGGGQSTRALNDHSPTLLYDSGSQGAAFDVLQACLRSPTLAHPESKEHALGSGMGNDTLSGKAAGQRDGEDHDGDSSRYQSVSQHPHGDSYFVPPGLIQLHKTSDNRNRTPSKGSRSIIQNNKKTQSPKPMPLTPSLINKARGGIGAIARASFRGRVAHGADMNISKHSKYSKISIGEQ